jgi:hypothetical protein
MPNMLGQGVPGQRAEAEALEEGGGRLREQVHRVVSPLAGATRNGGDGECPKATPPYVVPNGHRSQETCPLPQIFQARGGDGLLPKTRRDAAHQGRIQAFLHPSFRQSGPREERDQTCCVIGTSFTEPAGRGG